MKRLFTLMIMISLGLCSKSQLQDYYIHWLSTESKMPVGNVHAVYVDKEGYVWYSTEENLCRSNGYQIDVFCSDTHFPDLLKSNFILDIAEDNDHHLWFGTAKGVYLLDKHDYTIRPIASDKTGNWECEALIALHDGTVWISANHNLLHLDSDENVLQCISTLNQKEYGRYANSFYEDSQGNLWLLENGGNICRYDKSQKRFVAYSKGETIFPQRMSEDNDNGCYWIATWGRGIYKFIPNTLGSSATYEHQEVTSVEGDPNGTKAETIDLLLDKSKKILWVTAMDGLHAYRAVGGTLSEIKLDGLLPDGKNIVDRMTFDMKGNIWVSAFSPHTFVLAHPDNYIRRNRMNDILGKTGNSVIGDFAIADNNLLWIWDPRIGLELHDLTTGVTSLGADLEEDKVMHGSGVITPVCNGAGFWMASNDNILRLTNNEERIVRNYSYTIIGTVIFGLFDPGDGFLWAATSKGLKKVDKNNPDRFLSVAEDGVAVYRIAVDKSGNYFFHSETRGLVGYSVKTKSFKQLLKSNEHCTCMTLDNIGILWFGTDIGRVYRYNVVEGKTEMVEQLGNESGARILDIKRDNKGHLWSMTSQMVKEWNPKSGLSHTLYGNSPLIDMDYFRTMAVYKDSVCLAGSMGYCMVASSSHLDRVPSMLEPIVSSVVIDGEKKYVGYGKDEIDIPSSSVIVELNLSLLDPLNADQIQFSYRLCKKGLFGTLDEDGKWNDLTRGDNVVKFTSLSKGNYVLQLKATDAYGIWNAPVDALILHRLPAWWESWWAYTLYVAVILFTLLLVFRAYSRHVRQKRMSQMEEELTEMKFKFFTNISHELRTPLTLIMLPLENMLKKSQSLSISDRNKLETIHSNANELLEMINQLLDFRRMELGELSLNAKTGNISVFIQSAIDAFSPMADRKQISLSLSKPEKDIYMNFDHEKLHHVVWNLLSNALKFTGEKGEVMVELSSIDEDYIMISIKDNGVGIAAEHLPHVFDLYYQASDNHAEGGSGIGLHLVKELVRLHGGEVFVESEEGKGATFRFTLPYNISSVKESQSVGTGTDDSCQETELVKKKHGVDTIMLVEDNIEFRYLMSETLTEEGYSVVLAGNGVEALKRLSTENIDIVISDVMMPEMDGFELCKKIKSDLQTSHLPIILLTAKSGDENRLEGYKMGADYYMTKPFSMDILLNRIKHLRNKKDEVQTSFQHDQESDIVGITRSKLDEEFLEKAISVMNGHIDDTEFNVEAFGSEMCVSRMTLYRKLHSITGQSPTEFITTIRLKYAAKLLKETSLSVLIISEKSGFSSSSYFSKNFKKMFGVLPKDYR